MKKNWENFKRDSGSEKGSLMIEAVIGLTLITVGMLGVFSLVSSSLKTNQEVSNRFVAANLAAEGVEIVKNIIDTNVAQNDAFNKDINKDILEYDYEVDYNSTSLTPSSGDYLYLDDNGNYSHSGGSETIFKRVVSIKDRAGGDPSYIKVNSRVMWVESGEEKEINIEDHFYNWRGDKD